MFLDSNNSVLKERRQYWGVSHGIKSTVGILYDIKKVILESEGGLDEWNAFILRGVSYIDLTWITMKEC